MKIRGDAARLTVDGLNLVSIALRGALAAGVILFCVSVFLHEGALSPIALIACAVALIFLRRAFTGRPRLVLDRAEDEMVLTRGGEDIRRPLSALRGARVQTYEPDPRFRKRAAGIGLARMALVTDSGMLPFELPYRNAARARRLAEAVNGWLGA